MRKIDLPYLAVDNAHLCIICTPIWPKDYDRNVNLLDNMQGLSHEKNWLLYS